MPLVLKSPCVEENAMESRLTNDPPNHNCIFLYPCREESDEFSKPKIMYPNMTKFIPFYYDNKGFYQNDKAFMITGNHVEFLTAFLNSSLFKYCFINNFPELQGGTRELRKIFFEKIPVIEVTDAINQKFKLLVDDIQKDYSEDKAITIDDLIFDLYQLTEEERKIIGHIEIS